MPYYWSNNRDSSSRWSGGGGRWGGGGTRLPNRATQTESETSRCNPQTRRAVTQPVVHTPDLHRPTQRRNISTYFLSHTSCIPPVILTEQRVVDASPLLWVLGPGPSRRLRAPRCLFPLPAVHSLILSLQPHSYLCAGLSLYGFLKNVNNELMCLTRMCRRSRPGGKTVIRVDLRRWCLEAERAAVERAAGGVDWFSQRWNWEVK